MFKNVKKMEPQATTPMCFHGGASLNINLDSLYEFYTLALSNHAKSAQRDGVY